VNAPFSGGHIGKRDDLGGGDTASMDAGGWLGRRIVLKRDGTSKREYTTRKRRY